jgi:hypothetical protein
VNAPPELDAVEIEIAVGLEGEVDLVVDDGLPVSTVFFCLLEYSFNRMHLYA